MRADELALMINGLFLQLFLLSSMTFAVQISAPAISPSISSTIEDAQKLTIQKKRREAAKLLNDSIEGGSFPLKSKSRFVETLRSITTTFFTDKGQRLFESGQSAMFENPDLALSRYREALAVEDENVLILNSIARLQLAREECGQALETISQAKTLSPYIYESALLELRALICQKNYEAFRLKLKNIPSVEKSQEYFVTYLAAQDMLQQKMWKKGGDLLLKVSEEQPRFPESYYWLNRVNTELEQGDDTFAKKYLSLCKTVSIRDRKTFALEPRLCAGVKEVEDELQNKNIDR